MIESVLLDGELLELADVFAALTIRHGRGSADDGPLASTCSLVLVNVDRAFAVSFAVAAELELLTDDGERRFAGRITDAALNEEGLSIVAVSSLSWHAGRIVGATDWPAETWSSRLARVLGEAGYSSSWADASGSWGDDPGTWTEPGAFPPFRIVVGDADPLLAARVVGENDSPLTLAQVLEELAATEPAAIANLPDGSVLVQALSARRNLERLELDPLEVAFAPEWAMVDEVENVVTVKWAEGEETATDAASRARHEDRPHSIETALALQADAAALAALRVARRSEPEWLVNSAELLELEPALTIGSPVVLRDLPAWAPAGEYVGMVEGWEDRLEPDGEGGIAWSMLLALSAPRLSGAGRYWQDVPPAVSWLDAGGSSWFSPTI